MAPAAPPVCVIGKHPLLELNGATSYLRLLARGAGRAGFEPHVFCSGRRSETVDSEVGTIHTVGVPWPRHRLPWDSEVGLLVPWLVPALVRFGMRVDAPLIIHGVSLWGWAGLLAARSLRRRGRSAIPVVSAYDVKAELAATSFRGFRGGQRTHRASLMAAGPGWHATRLWERHGVWPLERHTYRQSRLVLVNHVRLSRLLVDCFGPEVPVRRIPCAPESAFTHPVPAPAERGPAPPGLERLGDPAAPLVVTVSRHDVHKGLDVFLEALAALRARGLRFRACLVGSGPLLTQNRRRAVELGLGDVTVIPGQVPDSYAYLRHAEVFALPSRGECGSGSLALLEAMQAGAAVVSSACDGIVEDVASERDALLVAPGRVDDLAQALARVIVDPGLRRRLAASARQTFQQRFSSDELVHALGQTYAEVLGDAGEVRG